LKSPKPGVILMDVEMPGMNGYETCRQLKNNPETREIDVIFVTSHDSTKEKLAGYEAGGIDYLIKPVKLAELLDKIDNSISQKNLRDSTEAEKSSAVNMAMTALTDAGELGIVIDFMRRSFSTDSLEELAQLIVDCSAKFGLENSVIILESSVDRSIPLLRD